MIWTNLFAGIIAFAVSLTSIATGTFWNNLNLLLTDMNLIWDVCVFSAASAGGLIILLNCIASFVSFRFKPVPYIHLTLRRSQGALTSSLIMTIRQFLSILINAGIFGNFSSVSSIGWMGVFW
jgi:adenosine 3'-phospho 5'-phosphosulfate transporter B2